MKDLISMERVKTSMNPWQSHAHQQANWSLTSSEDQNDLKCFLIKFNNSLIFNDFWSLCRTKLMEKYLPFFQEIMNMGNVKA